jgi:hypothetical protein
MRMLSLEKRPVASFECHCGSSFRQMAPPSGGVWVECPTCEASEQYRSVLDGYLEQTAENRGKGTYRGSPASKHERKETGSTQDTPQEEIDPTTETPKAGKQP